ncbi:MAG TPA: hypothetical protein PK255_02190 [Candidatus Pacearchaeota archaeon]|nr:hypothetical protein [Candidatus Pacearchaeota archaeon]HQI57611.1 hypothetical protein [Candidatus Pacearchaeota archaeon]HQJ57871.1 hypothetical protein [Candidatus Pacearchaeota archaeon]
MEKLGVLVGYGFDFELGGQNKICAALKNNGYFVKSIGEPWPRGKYVLFGKKYISSGELDDSGNVFGEGGNVQLGKDFVLVSDNAFHFNEIKKDVDLKRLISDRGYYESSKKIISNKGKEQYNVPVHVAPTGYFFGNSSAQGHIDLFTLLLPNSKILIFDKYFGKDANLNYDYNKICEKEGLKFLEYDGSKEEVWFPLNSLVLPNSQKEKVVIDSKAKSLNRILEKEGIERILVDMPQRNYPAGKINCQTNVFLLKDKNKLDKLLV